jgi:AraC family transcriptional regulator of adaptative response/methylated-DNA-[protein]-cysteine methyltransferase
MEAQTHQGPSVRRAKAAKGLKHWQAVVSRDARADGKFYYSVSTTGIYCRPGCPSRLPLRKNVRFHATCADAEAAGFRPCKRCQPNAAKLEAQYAAAVTRACRIIEQAEISPPLAELARLAGMSRFHFHRVFKRVVGLTPGAYKAARRAERLRQALPRARSVTAAIYDAGYKSNSRFYAKSSQMLGMKPKKFRRGGIDTAIRFAIESCRLGFVLVGASDKGVCAILLGDDQEALAATLKARFPNATLINGDRDFKRQVAQVVKAVATPRAGIDLPLDVQGTAFQQRVWEALRQIPPGTTASYSEIARRIGRPRAVRAVASACAANWIAVAIPCHRVVRHDGNLSGYRWGVERKRALLDKEREARQAGAHLDIATRKT